MSQRKAAAVTGEAPKAVVQALVLEALVATSVETSGVWEAVFVEEWAVLPAPAPVWSRPCRTALQAGFYAASWPLPIFPL